jgi:hypothetical protein
MRALMKGDERRGAARLAAIPCSFAATASGLTASFISSEVLLLPGLLKPLAAPEKARICAAKGRSRAVCCAKLLSMMCLDETDEWGCTEERSSRKWRRTLTAMHKCSCWRFS